MASKMNYAVPFIATCAIALSGCSLSYEEYSQKRDYCEKNGLRVEAKEGWNPKTIYKVYCVNDQGNKFLAPISNGG